MLRFILFSLMVWLLASCSPAAKYVSIVANAPAGFVVRNDTLKRAAFDTVVYPLEERTTLMVTVFGDSFKKLLAFPPAKDLVYWRGFYVPDDSAFTMDRAHPYGTAYPHIVSVNMRNARQRFYGPLRWSRKEQLFLHASVPFINSYLFNPQDRGYINRIGVGGIMGGMEYFYDHDRFWGLYLGAMSGGRRDIGNMGVGEYVGARYAYVIRGQEIERFTYGYGMGFAHNMYMLNGTRSLQGGMYRRLVYEQSTNVGFGPVVICNYRVDRTFNIGINYRTTVFRVYPSITPGYEHIFSLDLALKFRLRS